MQALSVFHPAVADWFARALGEPTQVQTEGWPVIASGQNALLCAPTGTGKTLAAFLCAIDAFYRAKASGEHLPGLQVLYISPLRSLTNDMKLNLMRPLEALELSDVSVMVRNGDTPTSERNKMVKQHPNMLLTTPESLFVLLTSEKGRAMLYNVRTVIVDELHAILDSKRGTHLALSLERLETLCGRPFQRIGLSATVKPLSLAADFLAGPHGCAVVAPQTPKRVELHVTSPIADMRALPEGTIWPEICRVVLDLALKHRTTLVFLNHRAACEKVAHGVNMLFGGQFALTHHGCVSREQRLEAEQRLKSGELRCLCATSSMELGIDVGEVDLVLQVAAPFTIASGLQRLGRAGHNPGRSSLMHMLPRTAYDTIACGFIARGIAEKGIESANVPTLCLDVLAQHAVSMAASEEWTVDDMLALVRRAYPYRELERDQLTNVLAMLYGDYEHSEDRPVRPRVAYDRIHQTVGAAPSSRLLAIRSGGTIPDRGYYKVNLEDGTRLGELDEVFVFEARVGDKFMLGSYAWQLVRIERDRVVVRPATQAGARSPFWNGDWAGRPYELGQRIGAHFALMEECAVTGKLEQTLTEEFLMDADGASNAARLLRDQIDALGCLMTDKRLVIENFRDETGNARTLIHSPFGGRVNLGIMMLLEKKLNEMGVANVQLIQNDDGILLHSLTSEHMPKGLLHMLNPETAPAELAELMPGSVLFQMIFRYNAARALMMGFRPEGRVPLWVQRLRSDEALSRASAHKNHPLVLETTRECMLTFLDMDAIVDVLTKVREGRITLHETKRDKASPMAIELKRAFEGMMMYEEPYAELARTVGSGGTAPKSPAEMLPPEKQDLLKAAADAPPKDASETHAMLMMGGDFRAGDSEVPLEWLRQLAREGRALYVDPGLWIAAEQEELYRDALTGEPEALTRVVRRLLRYRGAQDAFSLADRYALEPDRAQEVLERLSELGAIVPWEDVFVHRDVYERASGMRRAALRADVRTAEAAGYASFLARLHQSGDAPQDRLAHGLSRLLDHLLPIAQWEDVVLPARTMGYTPRALDLLLGTGQFVWRLDGQGKLSFHNPDAVSGDFIESGELDAAETAVLCVLRDRGALFAGAIAARVTDADTSAALMSLLSKGLVTNDSLAPVRALASEAKETSARAKRRTQAMDAGRWEAARALEARPLEERLKAALHRWGVLCHETAKCESLSWGEALDVLRVWEYTGIVRRGYFVRGLSGAQFVLNEAAQRAMHALNHPDREPVCIVASDPSQAWGSILKHHPDRAFMCVPSTAVVLKSGEVVMVLERGGAVIRCFDDMPMESLQCVARAFSLSQLWPSRTRIVVKNPDDSLRAPLLGAGFKRDTQDFVLWKR